MMNRTLLMSATIGLVVVAVVIVVWLSIGTPKTARDGDSTPHEANTISGREATTTSESGSADRSSDEELLPETIDVSAEAPVSTESESANEDESNTPPAGDGEDAGGIVADRIREQRMRNVRDLIIACYELMPQLDGQWPQDAGSFVSAQNVQQVLEVLKGSGRDSAERSERLRNLPMLVYRRPPRTLDDPEFRPQNWVLFHEVYGDEFPKGGVAVGFADGHIEWIDDKERLDRLMIDDE